MRKEVLMENRYLIHALTNHPLDDDVKLSVTITAELPDGSTCELCTVNADIDSISSGGWPVLIKAEGFVKLSASVDR